MTVITADRLDQFQAMLMLEDEVEGGRALTEYQHDPLGFCIDILGVRRETLIWSENAGYAGHGWDGTVDPLVEILEGLGARENVGVESGIGVGKTFIAACGTLWFLGSHENAIVITSALTQHQLDKRLWKEIRKLFPAFQRQFPGSRLMDSNEIRMLPGASTEWQAFGEVVGVRAGEKLATRAQGLHDKHMQIVMEEAAGADEAIMEAYLNTTTAPGNAILAIGNPDHREDELHKLCILPSTRHVRISVKDHPNVVLDDPYFIDGAQSKAWVEDMAVRYKHDPATHDSRVRGVCPEVPHGAVYRVPDSAVVEIPEAAIRAGVDSGWPVLVGLDFGENHFAALVGLLSEKPTITVVREYLSFRETLDARFGRLLELLEEVGGPREVRLWGDPAGPWIIEANAALKRLGSKLTVGWKPKSPVKRASGSEQGYVEAGISRVNWAFAHGLLRISKDLRSEWLKGAKANLAGEPMRGVSRLRWELSRLQWDQDNPDKLDKNTADGAHATDALRYLVGGWWEGYRAETPEERAEKARYRRLRQQGVSHERITVPDEYDERGNRTHDRELERIMRRHERTQRRGGRGL